MTPDDIAEAQQSVRKAFDYLLLDREIVVFTGDVYKKVLGRLFGLPSTMLVSTVPVKLKPGPYIEHIGGNRWSVHGLLVEVYDNRILFARLCVADPVHALIMIGMLKTMKECIKPAAAEKFLWRLTLSDFRFSHAQWETKAVTLEQVKKWAADNGYWDKRGFVLIGRTMVRLTTTEGGRLRMWAYAAGAFHVDVEKLMHFVVSVGGRDTKIFHFGAGSTTLPGGSDLHRDAGKRARVFYNAFDQMVKATEERRKRRKTDVPPRKREYPEKPAVAVRSA